MPTGSDTRDSEDQVARIQRFSSRVDAEVAASMLNACGIDARVVNDDTGGMHPNLAFGHGGSEVVVPDEQLEEATALLDDAGDGRAVATSRPPDEGAPQLTFRQLWLRAGAVLLVALLLVVVFAADLDFRWF
ncbi:MAG: DUF2007 domain-containing protein [Nitriliruptor sp.]|nr:MAG: DUF2007 domain-containing protein [Nitriliruptor sp.]